MTKINYDIEYFGGPQDGLKGILSSAIDTISFPNGHTYERSLVKPCKMIYVGKIIKNKSHANL